MNKPTSCPKIGIKIHETPARYQPPSASTTRQQQQITPYQPPSASTTRQQQQITPYQPPSASARQTYQDIAKHQQMNPPSFYKQQPQQQQQQPQQPQQQYFYSSDEYLKHHQSQIQHHQQQMQYHAELLKKYQQQQPQQPKPQQQQQLVPFSVPVATVATITNKNEMDFNIDNYQLEDILRLFKISDTNLTDATMKTARKEVLKLHPDKCKLDPKYYEFYQKAYRYLEQVFTFQNRTQNRENRPTSYSATDVQDEDNSQIVKDFFSKNGGFSTKTFNEQFEKYYVKDEATAKGYDDWFKSDEGILGQPEGKMTKGAMDSHIENYKRNMEAVVAYKGVADQVYTGSAAGGALLNVGAINNFTGSTSGDVFSNGGLVYTDLKQAYTETLIPISADEEYKNIAKYRNVQEYSAARDMDAKNYKIMNDAESRAYIAEQERLQGHEGASLAFYFAKQQEKTQAATNSFWSNLKQLTYGSG